MPKIISHVPIFDFINNGWIYLCTASDGNMYIRAVNGMYQRVVDTAKDTLSIASDFQTFVQGTPNPIPLAPSVLVVPPITVNPPVVEP